MLSEPDHLSGLDEGLYLTLRIVMMASAAAFMLYPGVKQQPRITFVQNANLPSTASDAVVRRAAGVIMVARKSGPDVFAGVTHVWDTCLLSN